jgi:LPS sulfotransferase NodH
VKTAGNGHRDAVIWARTSLGPFGSYLICGTPRAGSALLRGLLAATGVAGKPESYFRSQDERSYAENLGIQVGRDGPLDYLAYVRAVVAAGSTANGLFGGRVMWGTMGEVVGKLRAAYPHPLGPDVELLERVLGRTHFVHLRRDDVVVQAVSWARAEQTGYWQDGQNSRVRPRFDFNAVDGSVTTVNEHNGAWLEWFDASGVVPVGVVYEESLPISQVRPTPSCSSWASNYRPAMSLRPVLGGKLTRSTTSGLGATAL